MNKSSSINQHSRIHTPQTKNNSVMRKAIALSALVIAILSVVSGFYISSYCFIGCVVIPIALICVKLKKHSNLNSDLNLVSLTSENVIKYTNGLLNKPNLEQSGPESEPWPASVELYFNKLNELYVLQKDSAGHNFIIWQRPDVVAKYRELFAISYARSDHFIRQKNDSNSASLCSLCFQIIYRAGIIKSADRNNSQHSMAPKGNNDHESRFAKGGDLEDIRLLYDDFCHRFKEAYPRIQLPFEM